MHPNLSSPISSKKGNIRLTALDSAKAISVMLVVYWHVFGHDSLLNSILVLVRMPLFLFVAGVFAAKAMVLPLTKFLKTRTLHLIWLYVIWCLIHFITVYFVLPLYWGKAINYEKIIDIFHEPMPTLWFLYALAISYTLLRIAQPIHRWLFLFVMFFTYCYSYFLYPVENAGFWHKTLRLVPFFAIAVFYGKEIIKKVFQWSHYWWLSAIGYVTASYVTYHHIGLGIGPLNFIISLVGIFTVIAFCKAIDNTLMGRVLIYIGSLSIYIFVLHRIFMPYLEIVLKRILQIDILMIPYFVFILSIIGSLIIGQYILRPYFPFLEKAPWINSHK